MSEISEQAIIMLANDVSMIKAVMSLCLALVVIILLYKLFKIFF